MPNSPSCESVLREIAFGLNSLRRVTAPFHTLQCPHPLAVGFRVGSRENSVMNEMRPADHLESLLLLRISH
eukprot:COSAG02_NODE_59_length_43585_cov_39.087752_12_plen_71_part_00